MYTHNDYLDDYERDLAYYTKKSSSYTIPSSWISKNPVMARLLSKYAVWGDQSKNEKGGYGQVWLDPKYNTLFCFSNDGDDEVWTSYLFSGNFLGDHCVGTFLTEDDFDSFMAELPFGVKVTDRPHGGCTINL